MIKKIKKGNLREIYLGNLKIFSYKHHKSIFSYIKENHKMQKQIIKKLAMLGNDNIWQINNVRFYVPHYPYSYIQNTIVDTNDYFERDMLALIDSFLPEKGIYFDIGANIGNHTLYFAFEKKAEKIFCFEPNQDTYAILQKNIQINKLESVVELNNIGLSSDNVKGEITKYSMLDAGLCQVQQSESGDMELRRLDDLDFDNLERVDFMKIDVEDHEIELLNGAKEFIKKYHPVIFIEIHDIHKEQTFSLLESMGYNCVMDVPKENPENYIFVAQK